MKLQGGENYENIMTSCPDNEAPHFDSDDIIKRKKKEPKPLKKIVIKDRAPYGLAGLPLGNVCASNKI